MMPNAEVSVRRLRLAPLGWQPDREAAQRPMQGVAARVEDALRTSSKPAALLHRLVLVRRLRLRAAPDASAQSLALLFERAWLRIASEAQPIAEAPDSAEAVWADSASAAREALLQRWLRGDDCSAWFWQRIAPDAMGRAWPQRALELMLTAAEEDNACGGLARAGVPPATTATRVRRLLACIEAHGAQRRFVAAIAGADAAALLALLDATPGRRMLGTSDSTGPQQTAAGRPTLASDRLLALMNTWSAAPLSASDRRQTLQASAGEGHGQPSPDRSIVMLEDGASAPQPSGRTTDQTAAAAVIAAPALLSSIDDGLPSHWSGLWLLLPLLQRCGLDDADDPRAAWAAALAAACSRFGVPDADPLQTAIAALELPPASDDGQAWLRRSRGLALREARLPLRRIAWRRGSARVSAERVDIEFPAAAADVRIRRAGFDIDPGFVPWLGRVVRFHYR
jgi:hypothetical protein